MFIWLLLSGGIFAKTVGYFYGVEAGLNGVVSNINPASMIVTTPDESISTTDAATAYTQGNQNFPMGLFFGLTYQPSDHWEFRGSLEPLTRSHEDHYYYYTSPTDGEKKQVFIHQSIRQNYVLDLSASIPIANTQSKIGPMLRLFKDTITTEGYAAADYGTFAVANIDKQNNTHYPSRTALGIQMSTRFSEHVQIHFGLLRSLRDSVTITVNSLDLPGSQVDETLYFSEATDTTGQFPFGGQESTLYHAFVQLSYQM